MADQRFPDVVIDTDVASLIQKRRTPPWANRYIIGARVWVTFITVGELWKWAEVRDWGERSRDELARWIARRPVIPSDDLVARQWGILSAAARGRSRPRPQTDTWVAASCLRHGLPLLTMNKKDFSDFAVHHGLVLLGEGP